MKQPEQMLYGCDHQGCTQKIVVVGNDYKADNSVTTADWMIVFPDEPFDQFDCQVYCPFHKHRSYIPTDKPVHVLGTPIDLVAPSNRLEYKP